jgi:hypothetical protein
MSKELLTLALEAVEIGFKAEQYMTDADYALQDKAVAALREALAEQPAQRQWVELTDGEVMQTMSGDWTSQFYFARAIEAKLKEKNT